MNHESCRERLVGLVYGELGGREAREVNRHLDACETCRAERDRVLATREAMGRLETPPAPERVDRVVLAAARRAAEARDEGGFLEALRGFGAKVAAGTAVAVLLALVLVNVGNFGDKGPLEHSRPANLPAAKRRVEVGPQGSGVRPEAPSAEPRIEPPPESMAQAGDERAAPPAPSAIGKRAASAPAARTRDRSRTSNDALAPGAAPPRGGEGEEGASGPVQRFAVRPPAPAASAAASRHAEGAARSLAERSPEPAPPASAPPRAGAQAPLAVERAAPALPAARKPGGAPAPTAAPGSAGPGSLERGEAVKAASSFTRTAGLSTQVARDVERRRAAGELSEAVRRFEPCPGGDRRRIAWIDHSQRVLKLVRERGDGMWTEEWFDASGRLREALVHGRAGGAPWTRHVVIADGGARTSEDESTSGLAPETPPPPLVERDPSDAFFAGPRCAR